ncbi:MAG: universal stress protein, partial [Halobacteriales archaeon]
MFSRVLIAVDGSECAHRAAVVGAELAATAGAAVEVVHVVEGRAERDLDGLNGPDPREYGRQALQAVESRASPDVDVDTGLLDGRPSEAIVERAADRDTDLIVLGRRGHGNLGERLLGSTVERVLRRTEIPVLAVPDVAKDEPGGYEDVLVTTDGSGSAKRAGPYGAGLAR